MRTIVAFLLAALVGGAAAPSQQQFTVQPVAPGVYAVLQPAGSRFDDSNAAVIVNADHVIVVDTQLSPGRARAVLAEIRKLTDRPVRYVINTHWHGDHVQGNMAYHQAFPDAVFIAHRATRADIVKRTIPDHREQLEQLPGQIEAAEKQLASGLRRDGQPLTAEQKQILANRIERVKASLAGLREVTGFVLPEVTFQESLTLYSGERSVRLFHRLGHTQGDAVVFLPQEKVLITGDLLDDMPFTGHGSPAELVKTLRAFEQLDFEVMIPGHGSVRRGKEHLRAVADTFASLVEQVQAAAREGLSLEDTRKKVNLDAFRDKVTGGDDLAVRHWNGFIPAAIERAYQEATGQEATGKE